ncbi:MAG: DUF2950 domain-containing protein [Proteobacteria bacterium]|nr:DUF2950 domain-containing protein [Pseudomonadota bacterium]MBU1716054.1 DUF2950 domain-containing protein [Pseudomonadota bacterium]
MFNNRKSLLWAGVLIVVAGLLALPAVAQELTNPVPQKTFASPDEAVQALILAIQAEDNAKLTAIFGPGGEELISSGDPVADRNGRDRFLKAYTKKNSLENLSDHQAVLHIGMHDYPFPIALSRVEGVWFFDTKAGIEEILNRRIGRNELRIIEVLRAYTDAQRDYACRTRQDNDAPRFAQRLISSKGKHDGLYWPAGENEEESPFGPLIAKATKAGYDGKLDDAAAEPFRGYYFKILTAQGEHATGGAFDYLVNDKMILGFGMVAYPASYGSTGVKTFMVNQTGLIYEKDLGERTGEAANMTTYDPDATWQKVEEPEE